MSLPDTKYTKGQQAFIEQMARKKLVEWCNQALTGPYTDLTINGLDQSDPYVHYALTRKTPWLSTKGQPPGQFKILAAGWAAAASFLKR